MKGILCAQFSAIKVSCSLERATNQIVSSESGQSRNSNLCFARPALDQNRKSKRMNAKHIESRFAQMGARLKVRHIPSRWHRGVREWIDPQDYALDIRRDGHDEF